MEIDFKKWNKHLSKDIEDYELAYGEIQEKVTNENAVEIHTMLMKNDFANYLQCDKVIKETLSNERADLIDMHIYEKELEKFAGNKKR